MSATNFKTENNTYRKLIGNGLTYRIPRFQRDYSWTDAEWEDLWEDILGTIRPDGEPAHYMGYLVLQSQDEKIFDVIDGQQRLTTLSLIVLAVLKNLKRLIDEGRNAEQNQTRLDQIRNTYIGYLDPVTLVTRSKLSLNRNNDQYYQNYLVPLGHLPVRGFKASEHALRKAFEWYEKKVRDHVRRQGGDEGVALAQLLESMSDKLFFTVISVTDDLNAYKVFETLNARGVRLSSTDLLKNYLFSVLHRQAGEESHETEMRKLEERWESLVSRLGAESFPDFLRTHWNSRNNFVRQSDMFKVIRSKINDRGAVFNLLRGMEEDMDTYLALTSPESSHWSARSKDYARQLRMFRVRQPYLLIMAASRRFDDRTLEQLLRSCMVIAFRYNVIGNQPTNEPERVYYSAAQKLNLGESVNLHQVLQSLQEIYLEDTAFKALFSEKVIRTTDARNNRVVRHILCELEHQTSGSDLDFESDAFNIEHVLPQHPGDGWEQFTEEQIDSMVYRIGNMVLLRKGDNKDVGNKDYTSKRPVLQASQFSLTVKLASDNESWTPERIHSRQTQLAKIAASVWRIDQLS